ncbi:MFS transporter [Curvivirga aplysinae]|uniref:MFS transporter n=1 Tax=Curvivirga aplysinae TaxID=2529852 RepID=UPI0012BD1362|nr:MFS transporter [Curvivirga aplysinae]MTI10413.1 MFS transporter [Curvivirga aplysinae]
MQKLKVTFPVLITTFLSFLLLVYVGYGEVLRTAPQFETSKMQAQGEVIQDAAESFLQLGLPLKEFIGFPELIATIGETDKNLGAVIVFDQNGNILANLDRTDNKNPVTTDAVKSFFEGQSDFDQSFNHPDHFVIALPLEGKFQTEGLLVLVTPKSIMGNKLKSAFINILPWLASCLGGTFFLSYLATAKWRFKIWPQEVIFGASFLAAAGIVSMVVVQFYSEGVQQTTKAMADNLSSRLKIVSSMGLQFDDLSGIDEMIQRYRTLNPEISSVYVTRNSTILFSSDSVNDNSAHQDVFTHSSILNDADNLKLLVSVNTPKELVYNAVLDNIRNFAALFVATVFLAILLIQISFNIGRRFSSRGIKALPADQPDRRKGINMIKPVFFIAVLVETLNASFLPQHLRDVVAHSEVQASLAAPIFSAFFVAFAVSLIPAGKLADRYGYRPLLLWGAVLSVLAQFMLASSLDFYSVLSARLISGIAQGMLLIGVQSYILVNADHNKSTQGANIIVYGFNGAIISGAAIGSLLSIYIGISGVFWTATAISALLMGLILLTLVNQKPAAEFSIPNHKEVVTTQKPQSILYLFKDLEFIRSLILIGIPTKAVLAGVTIYALPVILNALGYKNDTIGQIIMFYAAGVLLTSQFAAKLVDRTGRKIAILSLGAILSSLGLVLIGVTNSNALIIGIPIVDISIYLVIGGVFILGIAHGLINAPIVTHALSSQSVKHVGKTASAATYRFLERIGHVAGPMIVANLLFWMDNSPEALIYIGITIAVMAIVFWIPLGRKPELAEQE